MGASGLRPHLVLASSSPRRMALLQQIGVEPDLVDAARLDESRLDRETPLQMAVRLARAKATAVAARHPDALVLAADTVVALGRRDLPKAEDAATARRCLERLSGRRHRVITGVCLLDAQGRRAERVVTTVVSFKRLTPAETESYLASGEWRGKAGGYAIQGLAEALVRQINGSYSNIVGLPLYETAAMLGGLGYFLWDAHD